MTEFTAFPGEGFPVDYTTDVDSSSWTVTAEITSMTTGEQLYSLSVERIDAYNWRAHVTKDITLALRGKRAYIRVTGVNPNIPEEPDIEQGILKVYPA